MAQPEKPAKTMSSRLMTMKFMQRSAAASPNSSPSTPSEPSSKRQRLSNGSYQSTPSSTPRSDAKAIQEALAAEEQKRQEAHAREAADRGESKWYLSFKEPPNASVESPMRIVSAGFSTIDAGKEARDVSSDDNEADTTPLQMHGRRSFGKFNRKIEKQQNPDASSSDSESSSEPSEDEDEDESDDPTGAKAMIAQSHKEAGDKARAERKAKRKADKAESARMAEDRRKKRVKLNNLSSISGGGGTPPSSANTKDMTCFKCGKKGHAKRDCPQSSQPRRRQ